MGVSCNDKAISSVSTVLSTTCHISSLGRMATRTQAWAQEYLVTSQANTLKHGRKYHTEKNRELPKKPSTPPWSVLWSARACKMRAFRRASSREVTRSLPKRQCSLIGGHWSVCPSDRPARVSTDIVLSMGLLPTSLSPPASLPFG